MERRKALFRVTVISLLYWGVLALLFDVVYCLNDDIMIESILSGGLTGRPDSMAVYVGQPLTAVLAFCYQCIPQLPWFGLFQAGCYAASLASFLYWVLTRCSRRRSRILGSLLTVLLFSALCLPQYVLMHYTVTAAVAGGTGLFLIGTGGGERSGGSDYAGYGLLLLSFLLRRQVFFLLLPFFLGIMCYRFLLGRKSPKKLTALGVFAVLLILCTGLHATLYSTQAWKEYLAFNDARTKLYDYTGVWEGEAAEQYYAKLGITPEELAVYLSYDLMLDEKLTSQRLSQMAEFEPKAYGIKSPMEPTLREALWIYRTRCVSFTQDFPYNYAVLFLLLVLLALAVRYRDKKGAFIIVCYGLGRSLVWMYLILEGRMPERVTVSLYLIECFALACVLYQMLQGKKLHAKIRTAGYVALLAGTIGALSVTWNTMADSLAQMHANRAESEVLYQYFAEHADNRYLLDVYATVDDSRDALALTQDRTENYLLLGGWITHSPLVKEKLQSWGYDSARDALETGENVYLAVREGKGITIRQAEQMLQTVTFESADTISVNQETVFGIYRPIRKNTPEEKEDKTEGADGMSGELIQNTEEIRSEGTENRIVDRKNVTEVLCPTKASVKRGNVAYGRKEHFTYESATCGCVRGANILLPADYSEEKEYPVLYFLHGIFGDENSMLSDPNNRIIELVGNLREDGFISDIIVVFPNMYASSDPDLKPGFTQESIAPYDNFINDLVNDLIPYVEANYSVMTDREHRGLIGFSMGGRESLFIGTTRSDLFSCIGAIAPAPGVTPGRDWAMEHPGQMKEEEFVIRQEDFPPEFLMICCGTKDSVVGQFPASYHEILTRNEVEHIWYEVPEADHDSNAIRSGLYNYLIRWQME